MLILQSKFTHTCPICYKLFECRYKRRESPNTSNAHVILYMHVAREHKDTSLKVSLACHQNCKYILETG